ncbi:chitin-binding protein [Nonomuraea solani]|uniref:Chitin-binding protein n=1 Tax=Nonomuraea solani TaxID=1144553 RepID=A0A1H6DRF8_9ACTN|nr:lytic polysaccharide monooxygenase [Nonomuraea solani]SEG87808.1 chitin-binding protein [Nonomuraea solani]
MRHRIMGLSTGILLTTALVTGPAGAHGALENPLSRAAACGPESPKTAKSAACRAARAGSSGLPGDWDNLRVANVAGRDRQVIQDGRLCSAGIPAFKGLDLARADWPATTLRPGARFTFKYRGTIPHKGTFRLYVTKAGYDPAKPLKWSDLERKPFLKATDPKLTDGSYAIKGRLPDRNGRHLIYTIWQNSDTPDTYYSCSDVIFSAARNSGGAPLPAPAYREVGYSSSSWLAGVGALLAIAGSLITLALWPRHRRAGGK